MYTHELVLKWHSNQHTYGIAEEKSTCDIGLSLNMFIHFILLCSTTKHGERVLEKTELISVTNFKGLYEAKRWRDSRCI